MVGKQGKERKMEMGRLSGNSRKAQKDKIHPYLNLKSPAQIIGCIWLRSKGQDIWLNYVSVFLTSCSFDSVVVFRSREKDIGMYLLQGCVSIHNVKHRFEP